MKKVSWDLVVFSTIIAIFLVSSCGAFYSLAHKPKRTQSVAKYEIWIGDSSFSTSDCTNDYKIVGDMIEYNQLPKNIKTLSPMEKVLKIEETNCKYYQL